MRLPVVKQLFSANDDTIAQTDIVMLLTPRIVRTHELTASDLEPDLHRHAEQLGLGGPPPLINVGGAGNIDVTPPGAPEPGAPAGATGAAAPGLCPQRRNRSRHRLARRRLSRLPPGTPTPVVPATRESRRSCRQGHRQFPGRPRCR